MAIHTLGPFHLDTQDELLFYREEPVPLGRRGVALLRALVEQPRAVVSKEALIEVAWPNQAVEESNLTVQIAALRRVLGQAPGGDRWIETMPRRGYRFIGPVAATEEDGATAAPPQADTSRDAAPIEHDAAAEAPRVDSPRETAPIEHPEAERRQITVLSCELIGAAAGPGGMDLDDLREAIGEFQRCVSEVAARHQGFVARHLGNHALVLFGYPEAHE